MRTSILPSVGLALAMLACTSEQTPTELSSSPSLARATARTYTAVDLGTLGGTFSQAFGINPVGQVVGWSTTGGPGIHAFLWEKGVMTDIGTQLGDGAQSQATAINAAGQVVGYSTVDCPGCGDPEGPLLIHAFLWTKGTAIDLGTLGGRTSEAYGINNRGQVVGSSETAALDRPAHAFLWDKGVIKDLGTLGGELAIARGINAAGQVVGFSQTGGIAPGSVQIVSPFVWEKGVMTALDPPGDQCCGSALAINPAGAIVGLINDFEAQVDHTVVWRRGVVTDLGTLGGTCCTLPTAINPAGEVVGQSLTPAGEGHAFLWKEGVMTDLGPGSARGINPAGQVVGYSATIARDLHATLWTRK